MTTIRYRADHLLTLVDGADDVTGLGLHSPGVVDVDGGSVVWSGPADAAPVRSGVDEQRVVGLLMPGLVDVHCHTPMLLLRGTGEGLATIEWLEQVMWPREARLTGDDVEWAMRLGAAELLGNGITTSCEMYFHAERVAAASAEAGLRCVVTAPLLEAGAFAFGPVADQLAAVMALREALSGHDLVDVGIGPHSAYALSESTLEQVSALAAAEDLLVHIHVAEQPHEGDEITARTGLTVPAYLDRLGLLGPRTLAAHGVHLTGADIDLFAARGVAVAHCPVSNARHASGVAPLEALRAAGVRVAIATDGPASHDRMDLFDDLRTAARNLRLHTMDASRLGPAELVRMVTSDAADALGRPDLGRLVPGARADMVAIDLDAPGFAPVLRPAQISAHLVGAGTPAAVRSVWVEGRPVVVDGRVTTVDVPAAAAEVTARARRLEAG